MGARPSDSCREYFWNLKILPLQSQNIFSLVLYVVANKSQFILNSEIHGINIRNRSNLHQPLSCLASYQKGPYYFGSHIKVLSPDVEQFKSALKDFLYVYSFYSLDEYFNCNDFRSWSGYINYCFFIMFDTILCTYITLFIFKYCPVTLTYSINICFHVLVSLYLVTWR
jgi:hypothetical protein